MEVQNHILHPLRQAIRGVFPEWNLPVGLNINGVYMPLHRLHEVFVLDYESIIGPVLLNLQVQEWKPQFYEEEADPTPRYARDKPRLDILITFIDGTWLRWHPDANLIWSTAPQPTDAMRQRMNRKKNLLKNVRAHFFDFVLTKKTWTYEKKELCWMFEKDFVRPNICLYVQFFVDPNFFRFVVPLPQSGILCNSGA